MFNPFTNPFIVGIVFIIGGVFGLIKKNIYSRKFFIYRFISEKVAKIIDIINCIILILFGIVLIIIYIL